MRPVNADFPKEMLPLGGKPAIQYAVEEGRSTGIRNIVIIINRDKEIIRRHFENASARGSLSPSAREEMAEITASCAFTFLYQREPAGESDAIALSRDIAGAAPVAIWYPDNIFLPHPGALSALKQIFLEHGKTALALMAVTRENARSVSNSGRVTLSPLGKDVYRIRKFHAKGQGWFTPRFPCELRTCGIKIVSPDIFDYIDRARRSVATGELTDGPVFDLMLRERELIGFRLPGSVFDIGNPAGYELCRKAMEGSADA
jgi:UTP--glucose-1-phosphate uridylyltransferase